MSDSGPNNTSLEMVFVELLGRIQGQIEEVEADTKRKLAPLEQKKHTIEEALQIYQEMTGQSGSSGVGARLTIDELKGRGHREILCLIAKRNNNLLIVSQAIKLMKEAGVFGNPDHASSAVYSIILRSKEFAKVGKGLYKWQGPTTDSQFPETPLLELQDLDN